MTQMIRLPYTLSIIVFTLVGTISIETQAQIEPAWKQHGKLRVSASGRSIEFNDGTPFIWVGTTAWALHQNVSKQDVRFYLDNVHDNHFTVVQLFSANRWALDDYQNFYGATPYIDANPTTLNPKYWSHTRWVIEEAGKRGLYVYLVYGSPGRKDEGMPFVKSPLEAYNYGWEVGNALRGLPNVIWGGGMDNDPTDESKLAPMGFEGWHAMAEGINDGVDGIRKFDGESDYSKTLMTFHVNGQNTSDPYFHEAPWLDFNMGQLGIQEGNGNDAVLVSRIIDGFLKEPTKPFFNLEPWYENNTWRKMPVNDYEMRIQAYQSLMSGAAGFAYGNKHIWPMSRPRVTNRAIWKAALDDPGRLQMRHVFAFLQDYPQEKHPDLSQELITASDGDAHKTRSLKKRISGCYTVQKDKAFVYSPEGRTFEVDLGLVVGERKGARWIDTKSGESTAVGVGNSERQKVVPPRTGTDWLLVIEAE